MRCGGRNKQRVISAILLVVFVLSPVAAYAQEWMPGMGSVPGSGTYLDYKPWRFTEQIELYNDYAMWEQQLKLPASERVANSFIEFQGKLQAGYRGVTVNQAAVMTGKSPEQVITWAQRMKDFLHRSPDARVVAKSPKGSMLAGGLVTVAVDLGLNAAVDALIGSHTRLHQDGSVCTAPTQLMCPVCWTEPHFYYWNAGVFGEDKVPDELASLFPGFETYLDLSDVPVYEFTPKAGVVRPRQPGDADAYGVLPAFVILNSAYYGAEWTADTGWLVSRVLSASVVDAPLMPSWGIDVPSSSWNGTFRNMITGAAVSPTHSQWRGADLHTPTGYYAVNGQWTMYNKSTGAAWSAARAWYEGQIASMLAAGTITEVEPDRETTQVAGIPVETPRPSDLPRIGSFDGQDVPGGLTYDDPLADWVDLYDTPATLPSPIETATGVDSDDQGFQVVLAPAIDEITQEARRRWPYAAVGMLFDPDVSPGEDPESLSISFPFPQPDGVPKPEPVEIRLDELLAPIKPWRPVAAALVAVTTFAAMWAILKPELHV